MPHMVYQSSVYENKGIDESLKNSKWTLNLIFIVNVILMNMMIASVLPIASLRSSCYLHIYEILKARLTVSESSITNNLCLISIS